MLNKITNKIDQNELMIQMQDWILDQLNNLRLSFNLKLYSRAELINNILSPSKIRFEIIEKFFDKIDYALVDKVKNLISINDDETKIIQTYVTCVKLIGLDVDFKSESDLKKIVSGVSPNYENLVFLTKLIEHANLHEKLFTPNPRGRNRFAQSNIPISKRDEIIENQDFSYNYIDCIPTVNNNNDLLNKDSSELFSFENLNLENLRKFANEDESVNFNFSPETNEDLNFNSNKIKNNKNKNQENTYGNLEEADEEEEKGPESNLNKKQLVDNELINAIKIIENLIKNKREIFKEKIRLFPPEIKLREKKNHELLKLNCSAEFLKEIEKDHQRKKNEIIDKLRLYEHNMAKVDKKLEKLKGKINENFEFMETEDYIKLKKNLIVFEKKIDNFLKDFNQIFAGDIKYFPQEKFSNLHLTVEEFDIKNEKLFNLGKSIEEVFSFISKLIQ